MKKNYLYYILATAFLALVAIVFFYPDDIEGNVLQQHDTMQGIANGQEGKAFHEETGQTTRWTNSLFGGMPNFQIAPSYPANSMLGWIGKVYMLGLPSPANLLFGMMIGMFILCACMKFKWYESLFAAIAWGFSSYFIIIIGAGHIWKFVTLAYIPPTIGGIVLLYRRRYISGTALTALFGALQLQSNHPQMTYYFLFVVAALLCAWLYKAIRQKEIKQWLLATGCMLFAGILAIGANSASLYNSYEYAKETIRGKATDLKSENTDDTGGMDRDAITTWSYGVGETFTLMVPDVKGGATIKPVAGQNEFLSLNDTQKASELSMSEMEQRYLGQFSQYFGDQPMTNGPVYVGVLVLLLAILGLFVVKGPLKWALFSVTLLALMLSWGHNFYPLTNFFIDHFPGYNKFRAVSSILVVVEFTIPLLALLCIKKMLDDPDSFRKNPMTGYVVFGLGAFICLIGWIYPSVFGDPFSANDLKDLNEAGAFTNPAYDNVIQAIRETRLSLVSADCGRSLLFIILGAGVIFCYYKGIFKKKAIFVCTLSLLALVDLYSVGKRYVDHDNFTQPVENEEMFAMTDADREILKDKSNYRVLDVYGMGTARSSYFHKTIGGYHAAKLTRYNDLLEHQINPLLFNQGGNPDVLNMLNAKYYIVPDKEGRSISIQQPEANGNAWFVSNISYVPDADAEMAALDSLYTKVDAVADVKFKNALGNATPISTGDTIYETTYAPNKLTYKAKSARGGIAVFSEIYFPWGWEATVDGKPVEIGRVDYVLRALRLKPGVHDIVFEFKPKSIEVTNRIGISSVIVIYIICAVAIALWIIMLLKPDFFKKKIAGRTIVDKDKANKDEKSE